MNSPTYYLYILQSLTHDKFYIGFSTDPWRRVNEHNLKEQNTFTSKFRPWALVAVFMCPGDQSEVMKMEKFIKRQKSKVFIKGMIVSQSPPCGILHKLVRVPLTVIQ